MEVVFWLVAAALNAVVAASIVVTTVATGAYLRLIHQLFVSTRSFSIMRRYDFWAGIITLARIVPKDRFRFLRKTFTGDWSKIFSVAMVPVIGYLALALPLFVVSWILSSSTSSLDEAFSRAVVIDGVFGALGATCAWLIGLRYVARPPISLPPEINKAGRDYLAINIYWRVCVDAAVASAVAYP